MKRALLALALATLAVAQEPLDSAERARFRVALYDVLFAGDERAGQARDEALAIAAGKDLTSALDALRAGPRLPEDATHPRGSEQLVAHGAVTTGYTFEYEGEYGGERFSYALAVPAGYDPERPCALLLDPGHGSGAKDDQEGKAGFLDFYRARAEAAGCGDWLLVRSEIVEQVGAGGLRGARPEAEVVPIFLALLRDVASRYAVDPDRLFVTGLSQTGFWTWVLGAARADRFAGLLPMASVTWQLDPCVENVRGLSIYALHGAEDTVCPTAASRRTYRRVAALAPGFRYVEVAGAGHDAQVFGRVSDGLAWMKDTRRDPLPARVSKAVATLDDPWCAWLRIDQLTEVGEPKAGSSPTGGVDGELDRQTVRLWSEGVEALTVLLSPDALDLSKTVTVEWNGKRVHRGKVELDLGMALDLARARGDWGAVFPATIELR